MHRAQKQLPFALDFTGFIITCFPSRHDIFLGNIRVVFSGSSKANKNPTPIWRKKDHFCRGSTFIRATTLLCCYLSYIVMYVGKILLACRNMRCWGSFWMPPVLSTTTYVVPSVCRNIEALYSANASTMANVLFLPRFYKADACFGESVSLPYLPSYQARIYRVF